MIRKRDFAGGRKKGWQTRSWRCMEDGVLFMVQRHCVISHLFCWSFYCICFVILIIYLTTEWWNGVLVASFTLLCCACSVHHLECGMMVNQWYNSMVLVANIWLSIIDKTGIHSGIHWIIAIIILIFFHTIFFFETWVIGTQDFSRKFLAWLWGCLRGVKKDIPI